MMTTTANSNPHPPIGDLVGMLQWAQDHAEQLTSDETTALAGALMQRGLELSINEDEPYETHADLWEVVLRIADAHNLVLDHDDWDAGYDDGWKDGYTSGREDGFNEGFCEGVQVETGAMADDRGAWWPCKWCGGRADCYRVSEELWRTYGPPTQGWLCATCFEDRLGRKLVREDMLDCCDTADNLWATIVGARGGVMTLATGVT